MIIARPGLGTINHTLLTISALKKKKLKIAGVVINYSQHWKTGLAERTNPRAIEEISGTKVLAIAGYNCADFDQIVNAL